jgi:hypothetical protein
MTRTTVAMVLVAACAGSLVAQSGKTYKGRLAPVPMTTAMASTVAGLGTVSAVLTGAKVTVTGSFEGLKSPATTAQIHKAPRGLRGPVVEKLDLKVANNPNGTSGTLSGTLELTPQQVADLEKGWFYVQLQSEKAPDGNLWGWLLLQENRR